MAIATRRLTEEEFLRLPDDGRKYELLNGEPREVPAGFEHDVIAGNVHFLLKPAARGRGFLTLGQAGFRMTDGNIRSPDVSFTRKSRLPGGRPVKGFGDQAPDLCIEVISPSEEAAEMEQKLREYFASGAQEVWNVFPETQTIRVFTSPTESADRGPDAELDGGDILPGFRCRVGELFELE